MIQQLWQGDLCNGGNRKEDEAIKHYKQIFVTRRGEELN